MLRGNVEFTSKSSTITFDGAQQAPTPVDTKARATFSFTVTPTNTVSYSLSLTGVKGGATMGHIHGPAPRGGNGDVFHTLFPAKLPEEASVTGEWKATPAQLADLKLGHT